MRDEAPTPAVLLPGLQSDRRAWHNQLPALGKLRPIIVPEGQENCASIEEMASCVRAQLPPRFHLVAWSMGGYIAFHALTEIADRVETLVLVGTSARPETSGQTERRLALIDIAETKGIVEAARRSMTTSYHDPSALPAATIDRILAMWQDIGTATFASQQRAIMDRADTRGHLGALRVPTLIIVGENDLVTPPDCAEELRGLIPGSTLRVIADCGHCPPLERPGLVNTWIDEWWDGRGAAAGRIRRRVR